jgi:hypothetical protein
MRGAFLVVVAAALAAFRPVEVFLAGFMVLGPLHYLTELVWLHERRCFTSRAWHPALLGGIGLVGTTMVLLLDSGAPLPAEARVVAQNVAVTALFVATVLAFVLTRRDPKPAMLAVAGAAATVVGVAWSVSGWSYGYFLGFGVLLPTVVHVLGFTALFMIHGCIRRRDRGDLLALGLFLSALVLLVLPWGPVTAHPAAAARYGTTFSYLNDAIIGMVGGRADSASSGLWADGLMRVLAFAYLHHYLNWFEKTPRIGLDRLSPRQLRIAVGGWLFLLGATAVNVELGLMLALVPNVLHMVLELPLNWRTIRALAGPRAA